MYGHAFWQAFMQSSVAAVLGLLALLLLVPVSTAAVPGFSIYNIEHTHNQMKYRLYHESLDVILHGTVAGLGIVLALALFRFMLSKKSADAYFAFGIKRYKLLLLRLSSGALQLALAVGIPFVVSLLLNVQALAKYGYTHEMFTGFFYMAAGYIVLGWVSFTAAALVCCMAGTVAEAASWSMLLLAAPSGLLYGINALAKTFLLGSAFGASASTGTVEISPHMIRLLDRFNPLLFLYDMSKEYAAQYVRVDGYQPPSPQWGELLGWLGGAAAFAALAVLALYRRKAEIAGVSGTSRGACFAVSFLVAFPAFALVADYASGLGLIASVSLASIAYGLIYVISQLVQKKELRPDLSRVWEPVVQLGVVLAAVLILGTGGFGYSNRIPAIDRVSSVDMSYVGSPNYLNTTIVGTSGGGNGFYLMASYNFVEEEDISRVMELHRRIIDAGKSSLRLDEEQFAQTAVPYDLVVSYRLWDGGQITRYYDRATLAVLSELLALDETARVKDAMLAAISGSGGQYWAAGAYRSGQVYASSPWLDNPVELLLDEAQRGELLGDIAKDVATQSLEDRYFPREPAIGVLMFAREGSQESLRFGYTLENALVYITPSFANTMDFMEKNGLLPYIQAQPEVESITLRTFNPYGETLRAPTPKSPLFMSYASTQSRDFMQIKDFGADLEIREPEQLDELIPLMRSSYFMSGGGYLAGVKLKDRQQYVYLFLPRAEAPSFVAEELGY